MKPNSKGGNNSSGKAGGSVYDSLQSKPKYRLALFDHLPRKVVNLRNRDSIEGDKILHPATLKLGGLYSDGTIQEDDDRVTALMAAFYNIIEDYKTPPNKILREDLDRYISKQVQFLVDSRQLCKGMGNVIKYMRHSISKISPESSEADAKFILLTKLQTFLEERILYAGEIIARNVISTVRDGDVIVTFGSSPLLRKVLLEAAKVRSFTLVVIDSRPLNDGRHTLSSLSHLVHCIYSPLSGAAAAMKNASRVLLGASCLLSNGSMLAPAGTAMVAALAKANQTPVIVAAETYKFSEKVLLDSIVFNELGSEAEIAVMASGSGAVATSTKGATAGEVVAPRPQLDGEYRGGSTSQPGLQLTSTTVPSGGGGSSGSGNNNNNNSNNSGNSRDKDVTLSPFALEEAAATQVSLPFEVVNLRYDLTPINNISVVATENGLIPPTSIPVLYRELMSDLGGNR